MNCKYFFKCSIFYDFLVKIIKFILLNFNRVICWVRIQDWYEMSFLIIPNILQYNYKWVKNIFKSLGWLLKICFFEIFLWRTFFSHFCVPLPFYYIQFTILTLFTYKFFKLVTPRFG